MRTMIAKPGVDVLIVTRERQRQITGGDVVDFDEVLAPAHADRAAHTLEDALGPHVQLFDHADAHASVARADQE